MKKRSSSCNRVGRKGSRSLFEYVETMSARVRVRSFLVKEYVDRCDIIKVDVAYKLRRANGSLNWSAAPHTLAHELASADIKNHIPNLGQLHFVSEYNAVSDDLVG